jgi:hypothetical protein
MYASTRNSGFLAHTYKSSENHASAEAEALPLSQLEVAYVRSWQWAQPCIQQQAAHTGVCFAGRC